jgi:competence protein ComEC
MQAGPQTPDLANSAASADAPQAMPLFHAAWLFAVGIVCAHYLWLPPSWALVALLPLAALACLAAFRAQRLRWLPLAVFWCLLGAWCAWMQPRPSPAPQLAALSDNLLREADGTVTNTGPLRGAVFTDSDTAAEDDSGTLAPETTQSVDLNLSSLEVVTDSADQQVPVAGRIRLIVRWPAGSEPQPFRCGEMIRAAVQLLPAETYHDPGVWDREQYLLDQGITSGGSVRIARIDRLGQTRVLFLTCRFSALQHAVSQRLMALPGAMRRLPAPLRLSSDDAPMLAAMIAGDRSYLNHSLRVGFERTGSFHMLVVSGLHLAIVAGFLFWITRRLRIPRVPATLLTLSGAFVYALFTGFATPVQRSFWMIAIYLIGRLIYCDRAPLNTVGFAALFLLAWNPRSLFDASLQMTLLAVIAIAGVAMPLLQATIHPYLAATRDLRIVTIDSALPPSLAGFRVTLRILGERLRRIMPDRISNRVAWHIFPGAIRFLVRLGELLVISCVIELAMALPMALYFHRITVFALPVNLLILPLLAVLLPAALVMLAVLVVWPPAAVVPAVAVGLMMHIGVGIVRHFGSLAYGDFRVPTPLPAQAVAFCLLIGLTIALLRIAPRSSVYRRWIYLAACAAMLLAAFAAVIPRSPSHPQHALLVEAIDVGQGDSLLLITPESKTLLVDGGGFPGNPLSPQPDFDIGEEVVSAALWSRGIRHLDAVALSHAHSDHMGGLPAILRNFHPDELWVGNNPSFEAYNALLDEAASLHVRVRSYRAGDLFSFGSAQIHVLAPFSSYQPGPEPTNNDSLVLHASYGATSVLLEGDAEAPIEQAMLAEPGLESSLLKVGDHGSITSTQPAFLARVAPQWAVISCGLHNHYGHPRQEVLEELQSARVRTYRTDINGISCFQLDGQAVHADPSCAWQPAN